MAVASRIGLAVAAGVGVMFLAIPQYLLAIFGMTDPQVISLGVQLLRYLSVSGLFISVALTYTGGLQGTGDTRSPLYITLASQIVVPIGLCSFFQATRGLQAGDIWLAILLGHLTRAVLSVRVSVRGGGVRSPSISSRREDSPGGGSQTDSAFLPRFASLSFADANARRPPAGGPQPSTRERRSR